MAESDFDAETKQLMADYKLIQYDITTGKNYRTHLQGMP